MYTRCFVFEYTEYDGRATHRKKNSNRFFSLAFRSVSSFLWLLLFFFSSLLIIISLPTNSLYFYNDDVVNRYWFLFIWLKIYFSIYFSTLNTATIWWLRTILMQKFQFFELIRAYWQSIININITHIHFSSGFAQNIQIEFGFMYVWVLNADIDTIIIHSLTHTRTRSLGMVRYDTYISCV